MGAAASAFLQLKTMLPKAPALLCNAVNRWLDVPMIPKTKRPAEASRDEIQSIESS
jgi:hypothetical protein